MTVGQLLSATTSHELSEWEALYKIEYNESKQDPEDILARKAKAKLDARIPKRR